MTTFQDNYTAFLSDFGKGRKMVLSTAENNRVSSRMMSVVQIDGVFYFQTDLTLNKYRQILSNPNVALCIDNIQIEGTCEEIGHPLQNKAFCNVFQECFKGSYDAYTALKNERLFAVKPTFIERWVYKDSIPYIETFDAVAHEYKLTKYSGV
ncbi:MAG: pyridoxamine 5'-phosphate oxidase family protein [Oscillospiraceae bacterium]|nr:pyridoxamine 5'-phosphate oxidase family protein [Oscillospiraceae bacterium]